MKRFILFILILQGLLCHAMSYTGHNRGGEYRRIGYTTNYASGNFSTSAYNRGVTTTTTYYGGSYTPTSGSGAGRPGQPRRSPGVPTVNDYDSINGPSFGGGKTGGWIHPYQDERYGTDFWEWLTRWGESDYDEYTYYHDKNRFWNDIDWSNQTNQNNIYLQNLWIHDHPGEKSHPWDPYMTPIGEPVIPSVLLAVGYFAYKVRTRRLKVVREE